jgi:hypothetical protein
VLDFHLGDKIPDIKSLKRGILYFGSEFHWFQSIVLNRTVSGPMVRQNHGGGNMWMRLLISCEEERGRNGGKAERGTRGKT